MPSGNEQIEQQTLDSLLTLDEQLRSGRAKLLATPVRTDTDDETLRTGMEALLELEAAIPRSNHSMPSWAPRKIGRFELRSVLGAGGFAVVYRAHDRQLNRQVALKVPRPHALIQPELRQRFVNEARAAAKLDHSGIVQVFEAGEDGDLPYIACALCEGPTLEDWLASRSGSLDPDVAADVVRQLADGLQYSHDRGILHRDIKPGNVLLFPGDHVGQSEFPFHARISDFGLAKLLEDPQLDSVTSQLIGTPRFMAPELLGIAARTSSVAADVYAMGAVLYAMLTGQAPFGSASLVETMKSIAAEDPVPPELINRSVGKDLSLICLKCLEKSPGSRYASAADLRDDLHRYLTGQCVSARQTPFVIRIRKWCRRHPLGAALALVSTSFLMAIAVMTFRYAASMKSLQNKLQNTNTELRDRVRELDDAVQLARVSQLQAADQRTSARNLLQMADVNLAGRMWRQGDAKGAESLLKPWVDETLMSSESASPSDVALRYLLRRITVPSRNLKQSSQAVWWIHSDGLSGHLLLAGSGGSVEQAAVHGNVDAGSRPTDSLNVSSEELSCVSLSDDRTLAATAGIDGKVRIWRVDASSELTLSSFTLAHEIAILSDGSVYGVLFLPKTHELVTCARTAVLTVWDGDSGEKIREVTTCHPRFIESIVMSPDGNQLATSGADGHVEILGLPEFNSVLQIPASEKPLAMAAFSRDGKFLACGSLDKVVRLYEIQSGIQVANYQSLAAIYCVVCNPFNEVLVGDRDGAMTLFRMPSEAMRPASGQPIPTWRPEKRWAGHEAPVSSICWAEDRSSTEPKASWVSADRSGVIKAWNPGESQSSQVRLPGEYGSSEIPVIQLFRQNLLRGTANGIEVFDHQAANVTKTLPVTSRITSLAAVDESGLVVAGDASGHLHWFCEASGELTSAGHLSVFPDSSLIRLFASKSGHLLCAIDDQWRLAVVELSTKTIRMSSEGTELAAVHPDDQHLIRTMPRGDDLQVIRLSDGSVTATLKGHRTTVSRIAFTPDGQTCITTSYDRTVCLWDCSTWTLRQQLTAHANPVIGLAISSSGDFFATADDAGVIRLWNVASGRELMELGERFPARLGLKFNDDDTVLFAWDENKQLYRVLF